MNNGSIFGSSLYSARNSSTEVERFCTVRPSSCTSGGNCDSAVCTRLLTFTTSMSGFELRSKLTVSE